MRNKEPMVSIVIPFHNDEDYIPYLLEDLEDQTFSDFEMIFVNGGSTDASLDIIRSAASKDKRIKVIQGPDHGESAARNAGFDAACGEYITFFEAIDLCEPTMIEKMIAPFTVDPEIDMVLCAIYEYLESNQIYRAAPWAIKSVIPANEPFVPVEIDRLFEQVCGYPWNKMFKRSFLDEHGLRWQEGLTIHEDMSMTQAALALSKKAYYINKPLYHHRLLRIIAPEENTGKYLYEDLFSALEEMKKQLVKAGKFDAFEQIFVNYVLQQSRWKHSILSEDIKPSMREALRNEWFDRLGVMGHPDDYILNPQDLEFMQNVMEDDFR